MVFLLSGTSPLLAAEGGSGAYVLGLRGAGAALVGPEGVYFNNQTLLYQGDINGKVPFDGGPIAGQGSVDAFVDVPTILWMTPVEIGDARLGATLTVPFGHFSASGRIGPLDIEDEIFTVGDPAAGLLLAGDSGQFHWQTGATLFLPIGDYRSDKIANIASNRASLDVYGALTWLDSDLGIDISNVVGVTFNGTNSDTNYKTGTEFHWEGSVSKKFENGLSIGAVGYFYQQLSADSGSGAILGGFEGRVVALGPSLGYDFMLGEIPVQTELRYYAEFEAKNRFEGGTGIFSMTMPLWVKGF